jgi:predicted transcriptional regulator
MYAMPLLSGTKTTEVRRKFPEVSGSLALIYASAPIKAVIGHVTIASVSHMSESDLWETRAHRMGLTQTALGDYLHGADGAYALDLEQPHFWTDPVPLATLRAVFRAHPPQSYRYLDEGITTSIMALSWAGDNGNIWGRV